ncbi:MAG: UDP-N-acetylmuramate--L-alanine ligase [Candidatus Cloacimonadota bacterium]|nr:MAG: UDP-N-acetylmuramate--L-alanine ligase [Candidatus Cloacimonadota bacterium]
MLGKTKKIHLVGIGGIGMSGIAELLCNQGFEITGSDMKKTEITDHLESLGIKITEGHDALAVTDVDVVVKSSAVKDDNPEVASASAQKIPVIRRAEMLSEIMRMSYGIGIAGTHGKTTTSSMVGMVLNEAGVDPTVIVGGKVINFGSNNLMGSGEYIVVEADEFDRSFLTLTPVIAGITNIEEDHLDCYRDLDDIKATFTEYANKVPFFGSIICCLDDPGVQSIIPDLKKKIITYGLSRQADVRAVEIKMKDFKSTYCLVYKEYKLGEINLNVMGIHNIFNSLLAAAVGLDLNIPFEKIKKGLESYKGVFRRFEFKGKKSGVLFFDDYAHHPTEIIATLKGVRANTEKRVIVLFQPHLYSRTKDFYNAFGRSFFHADFLFVAPIYPAREAPIEGVTGKLISDAAINSGHRNVEFIEKNEIIVDTVISELKPGDVLITVGAGDIYKYGEKIMEKLGDEAGITLEEDN